MTSLSDVLNELSQVEAGTWRAHVPKTWLQGRAGYGGLVAALGLQTVTQHELTQPPLRHVQVSFIGPLEPGDVDLHMKIQRRGKSATQTYTVLRQGEMRASVAAVYGDPRPSKAVVKGPPPRLPADDEEGFEVPVVPGMTPPFLANFKVVVVRGAVPFSGSSDSHVAGWLSHEPHHEPDPISLVALTDVWWSPALAMCTKRAPASSVRWSCHLPNPIPPGFDGKYWSEAETIHAGDGFVTAVTRVYAGDQLVVWSEQLQAIFDGE